MPAGVLNYKRSHDVFAKSHNSCWSSPSYTLCWMRMGDSRVKKELYDGCFPIGLSKGRTCGLGLTSNRHSETPRKGKEGRREVNTAGY